MRNNLIFRAGKKALTRITKAGLKPDDVKVVAGAAGGPKWLLLGHLDRMLFSNWFRGRMAPLFLIGSSAAAWRFASAAQTDPAAAIDRFQEAYIHQFYDSNPSPEDVSNEAQRILTRMLGKNGSTEILSHNCLRLNFLAARCRGLTCREKKAPLLLGLIFAALGNAFHRPILKHFFERALFFDQRNIPPFFSMDNFPMVKIPLNQQNLPPALLASGSIPWIMSGIKDIPAAPDGVYRDGGIIDYHMDIPFLTGEEGIVLFPHYTERVIPGWFDKKIFWRKPHAAHMEHVLLLAPSQEFIERLPRRKIPDRGDFKLFMGRDQERLAYWHKVVDMSKHLANEFMEAVESGNIIERIKPIAIS